MSNFPDFSHHNYQVSKELGCNREGGRISYLAKQLPSNQRVVIKQFRFVQESASWKGFKAYQREINILRELNHPRIPQYLDSFETPDGFCLVQEYKDAPPLSSRTSLTPEAIKEIAISVLEILVDLQNRIPPLIHRDLKPENILVDSQNQAYLIDFGLARLRGGEVATSSIAAGTPGFMPPEELFNHSLGLASDLYSLGATLISLVTNTPSRNISRLLDENYRFDFQHLGAGINPRFLHWLAKMVEPNVKNRYPSAATALEALKPIEIVGGEPQKLKNIVQEAWFKPLAVSSILIAVIGSWGGLLGYFRATSKVEKPLTRTPSTATTFTSAQQWFHKIKPRCNSVEVATAIKSSPYPPTDEGVAYAAGCYSLAGKIQEAENLIQQLPEKAQYRAAGIVFNIGHPVADAGDDESAGPIMKLVVKYQPDNYMALYHLGMSEYILGDLSMSKRHLKEFLDIYHNNDGWRRNALTILRRIEKERKDNDYIH